MLLTGVVCAIGRTIECILCVGSCIMPRIHKVNVKHMEIITNLFLRDKYCKNHDLVSILAVLQQRFTDVRNSIVDGVKLSVIADLRVPID